MLRRAECVNKGGHGGGGVRVHKIEQLKERTHDPGRLILMPSCTMPYSATSELPPAASTSCRTTSSASSPTIPVSENFVASACAAHSRVMCRTGTQAGQEAFTNGTPSILAIVRTRYVFPLPVGPDIRMFLRSGQTNATSTEFE